MRSGGGKDKGSGFEREICAELSLWISNGERKDCFWRSASSGGRATVAAKGGNLIEYAASDIAPVHPLAYALLDVFAIECKFYADLHLQDLPWPERVSNIAMFWKQVCRDAEHAERHPFLIAKQNRKPILAGFHSNTFFELQDICGMPFGSFLHSSGLDLVLCDYKLFLQMFSPSLLKHMKTVKELKNGV